MPEVETASESLPPCPFAVVAATPFYTPGGCSARILGEIEGVSAWRQPPDVYTYGTGDNVPGLRIVRAGPRVRGLTTGFHWSRPGLDLLLARRVLATRELPSSLHVHLYEGGTIGRITRRIRRVPYIVDLQGSLVEEAVRYVGGPLARTMPPWLARTERFAEREAGFVITSSPSLEQALRRLRPELGDRLVCIDDGVPERAILQDEERRRFRAEKRASLGIDAGAFVVGYLGSLSPSQGIDHLLSAAPEIIRQIPSAAFVLYGVPNPGSSVRFYADLARTLGVGSRVFFPGPVPYDAATRALAVADVAVTWKTSPFEANGKIPIYLGAGVPTVASRSPIAERYLGTNEANGGIVVDSVGEAAQAVVQLARDPELRARLARAAVTTARDQLSWTVRGRRILDLHRQLVEG